jgi:hypothetical protein
MFDGASGIDVLFLKEGGMYFDGLAETNAIEGEPVVEELIRSYFGYNTENLQDTQF